jgi:hypothetical protein
MAPARGSIRRALSAAVVAGVEGGEVSGGSGLVTAGCADFVPSTETFGLPRRRMEGARVALPFNGMVKRL